MILETPQSFVVREECRKAAAQNGYRRELGEAEGWARFGSTTARGDLWLAAAGPVGPWFAALDHTGVVAELGATHAALKGPGIARFAFAELGNLYMMLARVYELGVALPDAPFAEFRSAVQGMPATTEGQRLVIARVGQDIFRARLISYWRGRCPLTGITDPELLRASHIIPWSECESDEERLNVHNGLLLSALWDAAFDRALVSFTDEGTPLFSERLTADALSALRWEGKLDLNDEHRVRLAQHRERLMN